jgi:Heterokaryon incompatibility protein (HET)
VIYNGIDLSRRTTGHSQRGTDEMRLLNIETLELKVFLGKNIPEYAILSHTWEADEVLYLDFVQGVAKQKKRGYEKILRACSTAKANKFRYIWIDTCCIDQSSSAEPSEAINSMFKWYQGAKICYAYLFDVSSTAQNEEDAVNIITTSA